MTTATRTITPLMRPPEATVTPPGSKSITNRALLLAALAQGASVLRGALVADDTEAMAAALRALGSRVGELDPGAVEVAGPPAPVASARVDCRLSGTTARFLLPVAAATGVPVVIDGSEQLRGRPMGDLVDTVRGLGAVVEALGVEGHLPLGVEGAAIRGGEVDLDVSTTSQFLSALLLAGPTFPGGLRVTTRGREVARPFVDLTLAVLTSFGADAAETAPGVFTVAEGGLVGRDYTIEPDATAASYFLAAAAITGGRVRVSGLSRASIQGDVGFVDVLERMGAEVSAGPDHLQVARSGPLRGVDVNLSDHPDTVQTLAAVAVFADSPTRIKGVEVIRGHETDRIEAVVTELRRLGVDASETDDGITIVPGPVHPTTVATYGDHRMAMSFALVGLRAPGIAIADPDVVAKTYPGFFGDLEALRR